MNQTPAREREAAPPRTVLFVVAGLCAVLLSGGAAFATYRLVTVDPNPPPAPVPSVEWPVTPPAASPSESAAPAPTPTAPKGSAGWQEAAEAYARAFTNTAGGKQAWLGRLETLVSPSLAKGYAYTDLAVVPREDFVAATGGEQVAGETPSRAMRLEYTSGLLIDVTVSQVPVTKRWVVATAVPAEPAPGDPVPGQPVVGEGV